MNFQLNIVDENKIGLIKEIQNSLVVAKEKKDETHFFDNGHAIRKWGYIYESISEAEFSDLLSFNTKRQGWKLAFRVDPMNKTLFCLLSLNNLEIKQKQRKSDIVHYVSAIASVYNANFEEKLSDDQKREIQLKLDLDYDNKQAEDICKKMLGDLNCEIEQFCVLTLDIVNYELMSIYANILNENYEILYTEDWSKYIKVSSIDEDETEHHAQETQQHDMPITLKRQHKKTQNE